MSFPCWDNQLSTIAAVTNLEIDMTQRKHDSLVLDRPIPMLIRRIRGLQIQRSEPPTEEQFREDLDHELRNIFREYCLSENERRELDEGDFLSDTALTKLDELIIRESETLGSLIAQSRMVQQRFACWSILPDGPRLFKKYGDAVVRSAQILQRKRPVPVDDPDLYDLKQRTVSELKPLLTEVRNLFASRNREPTVQEFLNTFENLSEKYPQIKADNDSWLPFLASLLEPTDSPDMLQKMLLGRRRVSPASLCDAWLATVCGYKPEVLRQKISHLRKTIQ